MKMIEVCANSLQSAIEAEKGGAARVELCDNMKDGGTTPSLAQIRLARQMLSIQLFVIIRPRGGNFVYDDLNYKLIKEDIRICGIEKCDGVVFGILKPDGSIDKERNSQLLKIAKEYNLKVTFHRAIDRCKDILSAVEDIINLGFDRILTSGGKSTAEEGCVTIKRMIDQACGRIVIMPGSGINLENIKKIAETTTASEFHGTFSTIIENETVYRNSEISDQYAEKISDAKQIKEAVSIINSI